MSSPNAPHNPVPPQVVVRAGKTFVCSACGTLVEIPEEYVGRLVVPPQARPDQPPHADARPEEASTTVDPTSCASTDRTKHEVASSNQPPRSKTSTRATRVRRIRPADPSRERIDGLIVPTPRELHRVLAWIEYRLHRLEVLKQLEKQFTSPSPPGAPTRRPRRPRKRVPLRQPITTLEKHAHADVGMAPSAHSKKERGPP